MAYTPEYKFVFFNKEKIGLVLPSGPDLEIRSYRAAFTTLPWEKEWEISKTDIIRNCGRGQRP